MLDSNDYYLKEYYKEQEQLEHNFYMRLPEIREEIVQLASDIMNGYADRDCYHWAYSCYYDNDSGEYDSYMLDVLYDWYHDHSSEDDTIMLRTLAQCALEASVDIKYNLRLEDILDDGYKLSVLIDDVLEG